MRAQIPASDARLVAGLAAAGRPGHGWPASRDGHLLDVPQPRVRPDHDGRRAAQASGDHGAGPLRDHRAPDAARLREELGEALDVSDGPTAIRFLKGGVGEDIPALERRAGVDILTVPKLGGSAVHRLVAGTGGLHEPLDVAVGTILRVAEPIPSATTAVASHRRS